MTNNNNEAAGADAAQTRPARAGETDTTRIGMEEGDNTDISSPPLAATPLSGGSPSEGHAGLATGLQPGGIIPGGGPGAMAGSLGAGGGSNTNRSTGDADENNIEEDVR